MTFLLSGILAHLVGDFVIQSEETARAKDALMAKAFGIHGIVVLLYSGLALHLYGYPGLIVSAAIAAVHVLIDWLKSVLDRSLRPRWRLLVFAADQCAHLATIVAAWELARPTPSRQIAEFHSAYVMPRTIEALRPIAGALALDKVLAIAAAYVFAVFSGAVIVRLILDGFDLRFDPELDTKSGRYIGMLERTLMVTLVAADALPSIAFVVAAKSLARFRKLSEFRFGEYYLIGTLSSTSIAVVAGFVLRVVLKLL